MRLAPIVAAALALVALAGEAAAGLELVAPPATAGEEALIRLTDGGSPVAGRPVTATYYPASAVSRVEEIGRTSEAGELRWTPRLAGLVELAAGEVKTTVGVRFASMPGSALAVFLVAALLLWGGVAFGASRMRAS